MLKDRLDVKSCLFTGLLIFSVVFDGCMATYIAGTDDSSDGKYLAGVHIRGAGGRSYIDNTSKTVFITIETKGNQTATIVTNYQNGAIISEKVVAVSGKEGKLLLEKKYHVRGSDVSWDDTWGKDDSLTITLYDYGPGILSNDARKNGVPKRIIRVLHYYLDSKSGLFVEQ
jgi:hypothetical protein